MVKFTICLFAMLVGGLMVVGCDEGSVGPGGGDAGIDSGSSTPEPLGDEVCSEAYSCAGEYDYLYRVYLPDGEDVVDFEEIDPSEAGSCPSEGGQGASYICRVLDIEAFEAAVAIEEAGGPPAGSTDDYKNDVWLGVCGSSKMVIHQNVSLNPRSGEPLTTNQPIGTCPRL